MLTAAFIPEIMACLDTAGEPAERWKKIWLYVLNHAPVCLGLETHLEKEKGGQEKLPQICLWGDLHSAAKLTKPSFKRFQEN